MEIGKAIGRTLILIMVLILAGFAAKPAKANILDALKGHVDDIKSRFDNDRLEVDVDYIVAASRIDTDAIGQDIIHSSSGSVALVRGYDGEHYLRLGKNFKSSLGPDYHVYVSYENQIFDESGFDVTKQIELSPLLYGSGKQYYLLPRDIDVTKINSFLLWCKQFGAYIGSADLSVKGIYE